MVEAVDFTVKNFDVTVLDGESGDYQDVLLEGVTTTIGTTGMGVQGKATRNVPAEEATSWVGRSVRVNFYTAGRDLKNVDRTILEVDDAAESRYRWYFAIEFDKSIMLSSLNVNRPIDDR